MDSPAFITALIGFIEQTNNLPSGTIAPETQLIEDGHVDSFSIMQLILFIEEHCGVSIAIEQLSLDTISTPAIIADTYAAYTKVMS